MLLYLVFSDLPFYIWLTWGDGTVSDFIVVLQSAGLSCRCWLCLLDGPSPYAHGHTSMCSTRIPAVYQRVTVALASSKSRLRQMD